MGPCVTARWLLSAVLAIWIASNARAKDMVEVEAGCPDQGDVFEHGSQVEVLQPVQAIHYTCHLGFHLKGPPMQTCGSDGLWHPPQKPQCVLPAIKCHKPVVLNANVSLVHDGVLSDSEEGNEGVVNCKEGFLTADNRMFYHIVCNKYGLWTTLSGAPIQQCKKVRCPVPPAVPNAMFHFVPYTALSSGGREERGQLVKYTCVQGYEMVDQSVPPLTCSNGGWEGPIPTCVRRERCSAPMSIQQGKWTPKTEGAMEGGFPVGSEVEYTCMPDYRLVGAQMLKCTADRLWSKVPPICVLQSEKNYFCRNNGLDKVENGYCKCERSDSNDLEKCEPFFRGTEVRCRCERGYKLMGSSLLTCTSLPMLHSDYGTWDHEPPYCIRDNSGNLEAPVPNSRDSLPSKVSGTRVSTLVIVVATACSVLGVLLLIMVVVVFRRKKPRPRLFHPSVTPPPYSRVHNTVLDEHDRLALMAYADAARVHLPTYQEAVGAMGSTPRGTAIMASGDYRPLPSIPPNLRTPASVPGGGADNPNRHSTVTTCTMNRDGVSENFGSVDTVNVSMSDASTSVTVETFDSATSNRSMASQRATAGSIASSDDNLATDNAPLLDNSGLGTCEDDCNAGASPNLEHKDE